MAITLKSNLFWDYFNRFGNILVNLITSTILARLLSPSDYGVVGISMAVNGLAAIFLNLGFVSAIIQARNIDSKSLSTAFFFNIGVSLLLFFLIFFSSNWISVFYNQSDLEIILKVTAIAFVLNALNIIPSALMTREMKFKQMAIISLFSSLVSGGVGIALALNNFGVWSIIAQQLLSSLLILFGNFITTSWFPILYFKFKTIRPMMKFGMYLFFSGLLEGLYSRIDIFLIAKVFSPVSLGLYSRAQGLDGMIRGLSSSSLMNVLFPTFAKIKEDKEQLIQMYYQYLQIICFVFCFLAGVFYLSSESLFQLLFGSKWNVSADYFKVLVIAGFAYPISSLSLSIIEARGNSKYFFYVEVLKKILFLPTYFIAYKYGILPYVYSYVTVMMFATVLNIRFLKFELDISVFLSMKLLSFYFMTSVLIILLLSFVNSNFQLINSFGLVLLEVSVFIVIYLGLNFLIKSKGLKYSLELIRK